MLRLFKPSSKLVVCILVVYIQCILSLVFDLEISFSFLDAYTHGHTQATKEVIRLKSVHVV